MSAIQAAEKSRQQTSCSWSGEMAGKSSIEWTDATWNPVAGCTPVSSGCLNCYAARLALRLERMGGTVGRKYEGLAKKGKSGIPVFTGRLNLDESALALPSTWKRPRTVFVNSMSDLFHESVPFEFLKQVFEVMESCSQHSFQVLTKRPERALRLSPRLPWPRNVWMGASVESSKHLNRVQVLAQVPAQVRFLSCEPLIGPLAGLGLERIHWVIVGGESGPGARPMEEDWVMEIQDLCQRNEVPFFFKQWGGVQKHRTGRLLVGRTWDQMPQEYPALA